VIPQDLLRSLRSSITSIWDLELLLILHRDRARAWTAEALVLELRSSPVLVTGALRALCSAGLAVEEADGQYRYQPATLELDGVVQQLARAYAEFPIAVAKAIYAAPSDKIQVFADAFRLKKD
jgi:hypothetical protein